MVSSLPFQSCDADPFLQLISGEGIGVCLFFWVVIRSQDQTRGTLEFELWILQSTWVKHFLEVVAVFFSPPKRLCSLRTHFAFVFLPGDCCSSRFYRHASRWILFNRPVEPSTGGHLDAIFQSDWPPTSQLFFPEICGKSKHNSQFNSQERSLWLELNFWTPNPSIFRFTANQVTTLTLSTKGSVFQYVENSLYRAPKNIPFWLLTCL